MKWLTRSRRVYLFRVGLNFVLLLVLLGHALGEYRLDAIDRVEIWTYDLRLLATAKVDPDPPVVIVDIDESSLAAVGRWPWPRHLIASLLDELLERQGAAVVAFDVVFAEPDESSGLPVLERLATEAFRNQPDFLGVLEELRPTLDHDARFAAALRDRPVLLGYYFSGGTDAVRVGQLPEPLFREEDFGGRRIPVVRGDGYGANIPKLQQAASGAGHFTPLFDVDGITRRVPLLIEFDGGYYESLSLAAARLYLGGAVPRPVFGEAGAGDYFALEALNVAGRSIPVDRFGAALVPYAGPQGSYPYISVTEVLQGQLPAGSLAGRIVLIGTSATGLMDLRATPVGNAYPGVEIHANLVHGIISGSILYEPAYLEGLEILALVIVGGLLMFLMPKLGPAVALITVVGLTLALFAGGLYLWQQHLVVMPMALLLLTVMGMYLLDTIYALFVENRARSRVSALFGQYVPPRVVDALADNPEAASMEGESREMSVLFSDVRDFTRISEGLPANQLSALMNDYLSVMTRAIQSENGTVDKYIGDAIMAFWGAPLPQKDHAARAVRTALAMQDAATRLREVYATRDWPLLTVGIGINTGVMSVGNMGSEFRRAYTVLGDSVNLASRLEALTKYYGVGIIVSETTRAATEAVIHYRELDRILVRGKEHPVSIHEPLAVRASSGPDLPGEVVERCAIYDEMLQAYRAQDWDRAERALERLGQRGESTGLVRFFRDRIEHFRAAPPSADWAGVYRFETK
jgi:adenylate cyclase